jgi:chromosome segregation ATPase
MIFQPNPEFADQEARNRISELEECIRTHNNRISSLESRLRQNSGNAEKFENAKQQIAFLGTAITELKEENATVCGNIKTLPQVLHQLRKARKN